VTTLAERIRWAAVAIGYWELDAAAALAARKEIALEVGVQTQRVTETLKRVGKMGRPRKEDAERCPTCGRIVDPRSAQA